MQKSEGSGMVSFVPSFAIEREGGASVAPVRLLLLTVDILSHPLTLTIL